MTDFLVKMLIPDCGNTEDGAVRTRYGMLAGVVGIFCNLLLFAAKLSVGMMIGSISVMADGFNNLSDSRPFPGRVCGHEDGREACGQGSSLRSWED